MRRDERERKRELKILPSNCLGAAKPFPTSSPLPPLDKTSVGKRWLSRIHQNHSRKLWIEQFSLESSISEGGRSIDSLKYKRGRLSRHPRLGHTAHVFSRATRGFLHAAPPRRVSRPRRGKRQSEGVAKSREDEQRGGGGGEGVINR